jgi:hypothetical protein
MYTDMKLRHAIFLDLDKTVEISNAVAPMYINRELRRQFAGDLLRRHHTFIMRSTSARASFSSTSKLEKFLNNDFTYTAQNYASNHVIRWRCGRASCFLAFILSIELDKAIQLDDLRINILPFIVVSSQTWNDARVILNLAWIHAVDQEITLKIGLLRRRVITALKTYAKEHPGSAEKCPERWVNGHGVVKEILRKEPTTSKAIKEEDSETEDEEGTFTTRQPLYLTNGARHSTFRYLS